MIQQILGGQTLQTLAVLRDRKLSSTIMGWQNFVNSGAELSISLD